MDENKKFELDDEMLENVGGGVVSTGGKPFGVGTKIAYIRCTECGRGPSVAVGVITEFVQEEYMKIRMYCCGSEIFQPFAIALRNNSQ